MNSHKERRREPSIIDLLALAPHYEPLLSLCGTDVGFGLLGQAPLEIVSQTGLDPSGRWIAIISDDAGPDGYARGPSSFDQDDLAWILKRCTHLAVYTGEGEARFYTIFVASAIIGGRVAVIETQVSKHEDWIAHVTRLSRAPILEIHPDPSLPIRRSRS